MVWFLVENTGGWVWGNSYYHLVSSQAKVYPAYLFSSVKKGEYSSLIMWTTCCISELLMPKWIGSRSVSNNDLTWSFLAKHTGTLLRASTSYPAMILSWIKVVIVNRSLRNIWIQQALNRYSRYTLPPLPSEFTPLMADRGVDETSSKQLAIEYNIDYASCVGSLIYLGMTRVDILYAVNKLAKFTHKPGKVHFEAMIHLLRYLRDHSQVSWDSIL